MRDPGTDRIALLFSVIPAALLTAGLAAPASAGTPVDWALSGCAKQDGELLVLANCDPAVCTGGYDSDALASYTTPLPGTLSLQLDWSVGNESDSELLSISTTAGPVFSLGPPAGELTWCTPTPCSGSVPLIQTHLAAGETVVIELFNWWDDCTGKVTCKFTVDFLPDPGIGAGFGALDRRLIASDQGSDSNDDLGYAVAFPGDIDGDGLGDVAESGRGRVRVMSPASGAALLDFFSLCCGVTDAGPTLAPAGDVDGDGVPDLIVCEHPIGSANVPVGVHSGADGHVLLTLNGPLAAEAFGFSASGAGDLDGDGWPDVLVGAPNADIHASFTGATRAYSGTSGALLMQVPGSPGDLAGWSVAGVGDVSGDGVPDFAVGAPVATVGGISSGWARLHSGANGSLIAELPGPMQADAQFGYVVACAGDVDGDGMADVLASAPMGFDTGQVRAFSGATHALLLMVDGKPGDKLGLDMSPAGDWDGDGHGDVLLGLSQDRATVVSGATQEHLLDLSIDHPWTYFGFDSAFGKACAGGSDVDGDGRADFAVGAYGFEVSKSAPDDVGKVFIYSGDSADWVPPSLTASGSLLPSTPLDLAIGGGGPGGTALVVAGSSSLHLPFKGGLLMPAPELVVPFVLDGAGGLQIATTWPPGVPSGVSLWLQAWLPDETALTGFLASPSLSFTPP